MVQLYVYQYVYWSVFASRPYVVCKKAWRIRYDVFYNSNHVS